MELQDNSIDDLTKPQVFLSKINNLKEKLPSILEDFVKYYVFYSKNPEYNEYQFFVIYYLQKINALIAKEKIKNRQLKRKLGIVEKKYNGSDELISDYKEIYNLDYLTNFALIYGVIMLTVIMALRFRSSPSITKI